MTNLVVIVPDTLRFPEGGLRAQEATGWEQLRALWSTGLPFEHAIASSPWTLPSHLSLLNGIDPWRSNGPAASGEHAAGVSLASAWGELGGESLALSVNPLVSARHRTLVGYEETGPSVPNRVAEASWLASGALDVVMRLAAARRSGTEGSSPREAPGEPRVGAGSGWSQAGRALSKSMRTPFDSRLILQALSRYLRDRRSRRPLHLFVNLMDVHEPYVSRERPNLSFWSSGSMPAFNLALHSQAIDASADHGARLRALYCEAIRHLDLTLQDLFSVLRRAGVLDDAIVCVASDHGQALGENGFFGHGRHLYDEIVRVPAVLWRAGRPGNDPSWHLPEPWIDHRHLHDALLSLARNPELPVTAAVADAASSRGPAAAYVQAEVVSGFNPFARERPYRRLRLWQGDARATLEGDRASDGAFRWRMTEGGLGTELGESGNRLTREIDAHAGSWGRMIAEDDVSARLFSWGYG